LTGEEDRSCSDAVDDQYHRIMHHPCRVFIKLVLTVDNGETRELGLMDASSPMSSATDASGAFVDALLTGVRRGTPDDSIKRLSDHIWSSSDLRPGGAEAAPECDEGDGEREQLVSGGNSCGGEG
jgi:hypothetical protein